MSEEQLPYGDYGYAQQRARTPRSYKGFVMVSTHPDHLWWKLDNAPHGLEGWHTQFSILENRIDEWLKVKGLEKYEASEPTN